MTAKATDTNGRSANGNGRSPSVYELLKEIDKRYEIQFAAQTAALLAADKRYEERFLGQQSALKAALDAQKEGVANALTAQKEATNKAEVAADKRFDAFTVAITAKIDDLIRARDTGSGRFQTEREVREQSNWNRNVFVAVGLSIFTTFVSVASTVAWILNSKH